MFQNHQHQLIYPNEDSLDSSAKIQREAEKSTPTNLASIHIRNEASVVLLSRYRSLSDVRMYPGR